MISLMIKESGDRCKRFRVRLACEIVVAREIVGTRDRGHARPSGAVFSTFTVPSAGLVPPGFAATWTGIGGYNKSDLIQAATAELSAPDNPVLGPQYYAWYELLPASETQLTGCTGNAGCAVTPGENITVNLGYQRRRLENPLARRLRHTIAECDPTQIVLSPGVVNEATLLARLRRSVVQRFCVRANLRGALYPRLPGRRGSTPPAAQRPA